MVTPRPTHQTYHYGECRTHARRSAARKVADHPHITYNITYCDRPYEWTIAVYDAEAEVFNPIPRGPRHFRITDRLDNGTRATPEHFSHVIDVHAMYVGDLDHDGRLDSM